LPPGWISEYTRRGRSALRLPESGATNGLLAHGLYLLGAPPAEPLERSAQQIAEFAAIYDDNNRPTQPLRGRSLVLEKIE
jgi:hypothetical protein